MTRYNSEESPATKHKSTCPLGSVLRRSLLLMVLVLQTAIDLQSGPNSKLKLGLSRYIFPNVFGKRDKGF